MLTPRTLLALLLTAAALAVPAAPASAAQPGNPFAGVPFYVDTHTAVARAAGAAQARGRRGEARALRVIAGQPHAKWFTAPDDPLASVYVRKYFAYWRRQPQTMPVIALHGLPNQVCAGENRPGMRSVRSYRRWIDRWVRRIGAMRIVVVVEPDALAAARCLSPAARRERFAMIAYAARRLSALPATGVYLDAGAGDWLSLGEAARLLRAAGVRYARGFTLNVTHYDWTGAEVRYATTLGRMLGGKHFVVNTAANGRGPQTRGRYHLWCNPRGRALGPLATTQTGSPLGDALFWLAQPGYSNGTCNGGPRVGAFWKRFALELIRNTGIAPDFPKVGAKRR